MMQAVLILGFSLSSARAATSSAPGQPGEVRVGLPAGAGAASAEGGVGLNAGAEPPISALVENAAAAFGVNPPAAAAIEEIKAAYARRWGGKPEDAESTYVSWQAMFGVPREVARSRYAEQLVQTAAKDDIEAVRRQRRAQLFIDAIQGGIRAFVDTARQDTGPEPVPTPGQLRQAELVELHRRGAAHGAYEFEPPRRPGDPPQLGNSSAPSGHQ